MTAAEQHMDEIIRILRKAVRNLTTPSVTLVGQKWNDPFLVLISCVLSLRTKDSTTLPASQRLFRLADNPKDMLRLSSRTIEKTIYPVGFYRTKARNIKLISRDIIEKFGGKVPDTIEELLTLKGVGRKTANLVLTEGYHKPAICVDTHVHRISNRLGYLVSRNPAETEEILRAKLPRRYWIEYNSLLVMWGQNICRPISPLCSQCPIKKFCSQEGVSSKR